MMNQPMLLMVLARMVKVRTTLPRSPSSLSTLNSTMFTQKHTDKKEKKIFLIS
jgi:hypothetical protein